MSWKAVWLVALVVLAGCSQPREVPLEQLDAAPGAAAPPSERPSEPPPEPPHSRPEPDPKPEPDPSAPGPEPEEAPKAPTPPENATAEVVELRRAILSAIAADRPVTVRARELGSIYDGQYVGTGPWWGEERSLDVRLKPSPSLDNATFWEVDGVPVEAPFVEAYEGHVEGDPDALVRLTLTWHWARGSVRDGDDVFLVRYHFDENLPRERGEDGPSVHRAAPPQAPPTRFERPDYQEDGCPGGLTSWAPVLLEPVMTSGRAALEPVWSRIILDGDARYLEKAGAEAMPLLVAMFMEAEVIYDHEVAVRHRVAGVHLNTDRDYYDDPEVAAPLDDMARYWDHRHTDDRDVVHLVTGWPSGYAQANCIGGAGYPHAGYTFTPYDWERDYAVFHTTAIAHELGHIYAAHHHYGNHAEATLATIMIQGYTPGSQPVFSTLSKSVIRGWAEANVGAKR